MGMSRRNESGGTTLEEAEVRIAEKETTMRLILLLIGALILLPLAWRLVMFATGVAFGLIHLAVMLVIVIFLVGLVRRLMLIR